MDRSACRPGAGRRLRRSLPMQRSIQSQSQSQEDAGAWFFVSRKNWVGVDRGAHKLRVPCNRAGDRSPHHLASAAGSATRSRTARQPLSWVIHSTLAPQRCCARLRCLSGHFLLTFASVAAASFNRSKWAGPFRARHKRWEAEGLCHELVRPDARSSHFPKVNRSANTSPQSGLQEPAQP